MRPPEQLKDYFQPMEEYTTKQLDEPGGWGTISRSKRVATILIADALMFVMVWLIWRADGSLNGLLGWLPLVVICSLWLAFSLLFAINPRRAIRMQFWGSPPPKEPRARPVPGNDPEAGS
jgi:hypothetical protein